MFFPGEIYFNKLVTLGKDLPYLPSEVRKKILNYIIYNINCMSCNEVIIYIQLYPSLLYENNHSNGYTNGYSIINGNCICNQCKNTT